MSKITFDQTTENFWAFPEFFQVDQKNVVIIIDNQIFWSPKLMTKIFKQCPNMFFHHWINGHSGSYNKKKLCESKTLLAILKFFWLLIVVIESWQLKISGCLSYGNQICFRCHA